MSDLLKGLRRYDMDEEYDWRSIYPRPNGEYVKLADVADLLKKAQVGYLHINDNQVTTISDERFWNGDCKIPNGSYTIISMKD